MTVSVRDARSSKSDRLWIGSIYREYLDDLSALSTGIFPVLGEVGHREPDQIARWFGDRNAYPLVILKTAEPVGFALVARNQGQRVSFNVAPSTTTSSVTKNPATRTRSRTSVRRSTTSPSRCSPRST